MDDRGVALLGVGKMGAAFVDRWEAAGREVSVWNRTHSSAAALPRPGVQAFPSAADAVRGRQVVVSSLTDGPAVVAAVVESGLLDAMHAGATLVDLSTIDVASSEIVAAETGRRGIGYVRGAVSGSPLVVRAGDASLLLSGPADALEDARAVLTDIAGRHYELGDGEQARVVKIAINAMLGATMQLLAEATVLVESADVDRSSFLDAVDGSVMSSRFVSYKGAALRARDYTATFRTADMRKDMDLAVTLGESADVPLPVVAAVRDRLDAAVSEGYADDDFLSLVKVQQRASGGQPDG